MGNREDLLAGARRCLEEKGWGRTTVRDIATASGVSMAAIGYHFGSRESLLNAALIEAMDDWGSQVGAALAALDEPGRTPTEQYETLWAQLLTSVDEHRTLWLANLEALVQAEYSPDLREQLVAGQREGRRGMAAQLTGVPEAELGDDTVRSVGSVQLALLLGVMTQWLNDPRAAPSAAEIVEGLRTLAGRFAPVR